MYLTAQRVLSSGRADGINAFHYAHGGYIWQGLPPHGIPDADPGTLIRQDLSVPPPGNRVRSYLDIVAPDETTPAEIRQGFVTFVSQAQLRPFPWVGVVGRTFFRVGMEQPLARFWQHEIAELYRATQSVRLAS